MNQRPQKRIVVVVVVVVERFDRSDRMTMFVLVRLNEPVDRDTCTHARRESERAELGRTTYRPLGHENRFPSFFLSPSPFCAWRRRETMFFSLFFSFLDSMACCVRVCLCAARRRHRAEEIHLSSSAFFRLRAEGGRERGGSKRGKTGGKYGAFSFFRLAFVFASPSMLLLLVAAAAVVGKGACMNVYGSLSEQQTFCSLTFIHRFCRPSLPLSLSLPPFFLSFHIINKVLSERE